MQILILILSSRLLRQQQPYLFLVQHTVLPNATNGSRPQKDEAVYRRGSSGHRRKTPAAIFAAGQALILQYIVNEFCSRNRRIFCGANERSAFAGFG
jgi:hypothetical protein